MDIRLRSRRYSPEFRAETALIGVTQLTLIAAGWRDSAANSDSPFPRPYSLALAAYFQSVADRKARARMFRGTVEEYIAILNAVATN